VLTSSRLQRGLLVTLVGLLAAITVVLVAMTSGGGSTSQHHASGLLGGSLPPHLVAKDFRLTDQHGQPVSLSQFRGRVVALTFIHSKCHDACPLMVQDIKGALDLLGSRGGNVAALGVSVAPAEDTAASRRRFLDQIEMDGRLRFLSGPLAQLRRVWRDYAIQPVQHPGSSEDAHSTFVLLIDRRGIERVGWPADQITPENLAHDITTLERQS
jgi:protein SCO1/2